MADEPKALDKINFIRDIKFEGDILTISLGTLFFDDKGKLKKDKIRGVGSLIIQIPGGKIVPSPL